MFLLQTQFINLFYGSNLLFCFIFAHPSLKICNFFISTSFISSFFRESFSQINNKKPCSLCFAAASPFLYCSQAGLKAGSICFIVPPGGRSTGPLCFLLELYIHNGHSFSSLLCTTQLLQSQVVTFFKNLRFMFLI